MAFASAVGLALLVAIHQNPPAVPAGGAASPAMLAAALSNQTLAAYVAPQASQEWNLPSASFEYTNLGRPLTRPQRGPSER